MLPLKILGPENTAVIDLSQKFYDVYPISEACERFKGIARMNITYARGEGSIRITISPKGEFGIETLALEFCNYVLHAQAKGV